MGYIRTSGKPKQYARLIWNTFARGDPTAENRLAQFLLVTPIEIPFKCIIDHIGWINGTAAGSVKAVIYRDNGDTSEGGALVVQSGATACAGNGQKQEAVIAETLLVAGLYWIGILVQGAVNADMYGNAANEHDLGGTLQGEHDDVNSDTVPDPAPTPDSNSRSPYMYVRVKEVLI